jgi:hypothetical protein
MTIRSHPPVIGRNPKAQAGVRRGDAKPQKQASTSATTGSASSTYATPLVRKLAAEANLDLATITGTGAGGRVTAGDVRAAAGPRQRPATAPRAATSGTQVLVDVHSSWAFATSLHTQGHPTVRVDVHGANPLAAEMRAAAPGQFVRARERSGEPPTLFANGDLPPITASGMAPELLNKLPWPARPAAARAAGPEAHAIFERFGGGTPEAYEDAAMEFALDPAVLGYYAQMQEWGDSG